MEKLFNELWQARRRAMVEFGAYRSVELRWLIHPMTFHSIMETEEFVREYRVNGKPSLWGIPIIVSSDVEGFELVLKT